MAIDVPHTNVVVEVGILTQRELEQLPKPLQQDLLKCTRDLVECYGAAWVRQEAPRLREEIDFMHGL